MTVKMQPGYLLLPKSIVLGALQISGLYFFCGFLEELGILASLTLVRVKGWHFCGFLPNSKILTVPSSFPVLTLHNALLLSFQKLDNPPVQSHLLYLKLHE